ncbi:ATP-binding protein [Chitinimonas viridis]|uniref:ATP-binding protein n=1 Tax=Chitinimonas viridis TaxID=664880 RepID=A0ABT8B0B0_9NEIS|nr:ATP-binding protein [Chitinimonas viridis]MDN3575657.1 ATP-binding protein [Chitinimonas viridis]
MPVESVEELKGLIEIRPEVTMLSVLRHLNYKAWFALAEFIDNSLQSYLANRETLESLHGTDFRLVVDVRLDTNAPGQIVVTDNAAGISEADFPRAFRAAHVPTDRSGLSEFGMGMKSAACWFAENWSVRTKALGEQLERTINFDIRHIVDNKIESLDTTARDIDNLSAHYTVVTLRGLHHVPQGRTLGKIKEHLASIYRVFLRDGRMTLKFNGECLVYETPAILHAVQYTSPGVAALGENAHSVLWRKNISLDFGEGQHVTGFAALREIGSTPFAGFALFRRDRLIEGSYDETYRPSHIFKQTNSYPYQRLFGELHVEGFEVSHTKDGFRWEQYEDVFLDCLKEKLELEPLDLLAQAENYRALPSKKNIEVKAEAATFVVAQYLEKHIAPLLLEAQSNPALDVPPIPDSMPRGPLQASERAIEIDDGTWQWIITLRTSVDPAREDWVSLAKQQSECGDEDLVRRICVDLALAHPFSSEFLGASNENIELMLRVAAAVAIALVLAEDITGEAPDSVLYHLNYLMRGALSQVALTK